MSQCWRLVTLAVPQGSVLLCFISKAAAAQEGESAYVRQNRDVHLLFQVRSREMMPAVSHANLESSLLTFVGFSTRRYDIQPDDLFLK